MGINRVISISTRVVEWKSTCVFPDLIEHFKKSHQKNEKWVKEIYETRYVTKSESRGSRDRNIELRLPIPLEPNRFMDDASDEVNEGDALEDVVDAGVEVQFTSGNELEGRECVHAYVTDYPDSIVKNRIRYTNEVQLIDWLIVRPIAATLVCGASVILGHDPVLGIRANYTTWAIRMQIILEANGLWEMIEPNKRDQRQQRREASNLVEEDLEPTLLMASTSFNKTQRKSSKDTPTNKSIWFAKDYDHEDSNFGEIILEEDKEGQDQDYDKLRSNENEDIEDTAIVIRKENIGSNPIRPKVPPVRQCIASISSPSFISSCRKTCNRSAGPDNAYAIDKGGCPLAKGRGGILSNVIPSPWTRLRTGTTTSFGSTRGYSRPSWTGERMPPRTGYRLRVKVRSGPRAPHEVPLLTLTAPRVIEMDELAATDSSGVPSIIERSPLDFAHEAGPRIRESRLQKYHCPRTYPLPLLLGQGESLAAIRLGLASTLAPEDAPMGVSDPDSLSVADAPSHHPTDVAQSSQGIATAWDPGSENASSPAEVGSPGSVYRPEWGITNGSLLDTPEACQDLVDHAAPPSYFSELRHIRNEEFLGQYNINLARQVALGSQLRLRFKEEAKLLRKSVAQVARQDQRIQARELEIKNLEARQETEAEMKKVAKDKSAGLIKELEDLRARLSDLQVGNEHLSQQVATLEEQVSGEEKLKAPFEEFKRYEDERVEQRCSELDARLDVQSIDFDEELYPHMLTAIAGCRWVIRHGLRLAMMKCAESLEMWQAFADVVSAGVAKGMSEGLKHGVEHGQAQLKVESIEAYDSEAKAKFVAALQSLRDLKSDGVPVSVPTVVPQGLALLLVDATTQTDLEDTYKDGLDDPKEELFEPSRNPFLYQVNLLETLHKEQNTVSLIVGADSTIQLWCENQNVKMGRDTVQLETAVNTISHEYLLEFTSEYGIPETLHLVLPGPEDRIVDFPEGYYQIHLSQLSVNGAAKVSHFEINCRVLNVIPTLNLFRVFYTPSFNSGWMSFSKRPGRNTPQCYTKPLDSLKNWNNRFFWVDKRVFPTVVDWRMNAPKDEMPAAGTYSPEAVWVLDTHRTPIQKQPEMLLCLVGISRRYYLEVYPIFLHDDDWDMDLFNLIRAPNPTKVKVGSRPRAPHEVPLLTLTAPLVIEMDEPAATDSSGVPSTIERSPLDFAHEAGASDQGAAAPKIPLSEDVPATVAFRAGQAEETATMDPPTAPESHKRGHDGTDVNAPTKSLRRDYADPQPSGSSHGGKSLAAIRLCLASTVAPEDAPMGVSDPDSLSVADAPSHHPTDVAQSSQGIAAAGDPGSKNASSPAEVGSPGSVYPPEWGITNGSLFDTPEACQDLVDHAAPPGYFFELRHMRNEEFIGQYNINLARQVALGSQLRLRFEQEAKLLRKSVAQVARRDQRIQARELEIKNLEARLETEAEMKKVVKDKSAGLIKELEDLRARLSDLQVGNEHLSQQVATLEEQVSGEEKLKAPFEEFKRYEDERVEQRCSELDARLDVLSIDFDEELYPHMLTAIAGCRWVIRHGLRLAMMKCAESLEMWQAFADVVSAGVAKGMSEGLKHGVEHGQAQLKVESIEAYDSEAKAKFVAALQSLRDLKYPLLYQLEGLKDSPMDVIMAALYLESDTGGMPQSIYATSAPAPLSSPSPCIRRSDGVPVPIPTVVPQGLALLLVDAATQTELEDT
nr:transposase (putative), gypsy type [Tanacetum cinerariifolium]